MPRKNSKSPGELANRLEEMRKAVVKDDRDQKNGYRLADLIDIPSLQLLLEIRDLPIGIMDQENRILAAVKWQPICVKFHRANPVSCKRCLESDSYIKKHLEDNKFAEYHCANGMWDIAIPIIIEKQHSGTIFIGQFFYTTDVIDYIFFEKQAAELGFDWPEYKKALEAVPRFTREQVKGFMEFNRVLVHILAEQGLANLKLKREMEERSKAEEKLRISEERWQFALDGSGDGVWDWSLKTDKVFFSKGWKEMMGYAGDEVIDNMKEWSKLIHPDDKENCFSNIDKHLKSENPFYTSEYRLRCKDGTYKWILSRGKIVEYDENNKPVRMIGTHTDITERKRNEERLRESEERWQFALEGAGDGVWDWNPQTNQVFFSKRWKEMLGYSEDEIGNNLDEWRTRIHPEDKRHCFDEIGKLMNGEIPEYHTEHRLLCKNGTYKWILDRGRIIRKDEKGRPIRVIGTHSDITGRKNTESRIIEMNERLTALINSTPDIICFKDGNGRWLEANKADLELFGLVNTDYRGRTDSELAEYTLSIYKDSFLKCEESDEAAWKKGTISKGEERIPCPDGSVKVYDVIKVPLFGKNGERRGLVVFGRDITDRIAIEDALRESEKRYELIAKNSADVIWILDIETMKFDYISPSVKGLRGYTVEEVFRQEVKDTMTPESFEKIRKNLPETIRRFIEGDESSRVRLTEIDQYHIDGSIVNTEVVTTFMTDDNGKPVKVLGVSRDITQRKKYQESFLRLSKEMQNFFDLTVDFFCITDSAGFLKRINPQWESRLGYRFEEIIDHQFYDFVHPGDLQTTRDIMSILLKGMPVHGFVNRYRKKDDEYIWLEWNAIISEGMVYASAREITERILSAQALDFQLRIMNTLLENLPIAVQMVEAGTGKLLISNDQADILLGRKVLTFTNEETVSREFTAIRSPDGDPYPVSEMPLILAMKGTKSHVDDMIIMRPNDSPVHLEIFGSPVFDKDGKVIAGLVSFFDIGDRKKAEEERISLERQVQHTQKLESLGILAGGIAHDFNNILTAILGHASLALLDVPSDSSITENLGEIEKAAHRAADLARQMLAYSGRGKFLIQEINLNEVVKEMIQLISVSVSKKITIRYDLTENLPSIEADATQIRQVILNLITNASDAIGDHPGIITISSGEIYFDKKKLEESEDLFRRETDQILKEGNFIFFEVNDDGEGMSGEVLGKIFDPFFTTKFTGRGLGLAAVLGIVRGHKGLIKIDTSPGKGTSFRVLFPESRILKNTAKLLKSPVKSEQIHLSGTVLVVDDEKAVRDVAARVLERNGFDVLLAADGYEALKIFVTHAGKISIVLLDMTMPQMDGKAVYDQIRHIDPNIPVLLTSGYSEQEATSRFQSAGLSGFIQKPFDNNELIRKIHAILQHRA